MTLSAKGVDKYGKFYLHIDGEGWVGENYRPVSRPIAWEISTTHLYSPREDTWAEVINLCPHPLSIKVGNSILNWDECKYPPRLKESVENVGWLGLAPIKRHIYGEPISMPVLVSSPQVYYVVGVRMQAPLQAMYPTVNFVSPSSKVERGGKVHWDGFSII